MFSSRNSALGRAYLVCLAASLTTFSSLFFNPVVSAADVTFTPVGFLAGDETSLVYDVDNAVTIAGCYSYHRDPDTFQRVFTDAARWTPSEGMQPLPRLSDTANGQNLPLSFAGARDVTANGNHVAFTAPTEDATARASAISDPDGSNLVELTSLPNGDKMEVVTQLSEDGLTAFGYRLVDLYRRGSIWTASGGVQALTPLPGFTNIAPTDRSISSDGKVSAGDVFSVDPTEFFVSAQRAYRWTQAGGVELIPLFPDDVRNSTAALSADGSKLLGSGSQVIYGGIYFHRFFLWSDSGVMVDLATPQYDPNGSASNGGAGLTTNADLILISAGGYSFIRREGYDYFFKVEDILDQAGAGAAIDGWSSFSAVGITPDGNTIFGQALNPNGKLEGFIARFSPNYLRGITAAPPEITSVLTATATLGESLVYAIRATNAPESFGAENLPDGFSVQTATSQPGTELVGIVSGTSITPGVYTIPISATNIAGTAHATLTLTVQYPLYLPRLVNISTRTDVLTDDKVLIAGFIIPEGGPKKVILRAIGPSLAAAGVSGPLSDPILELHYPDGTTVSNDNWKDTQQAEIEATQIPPSDDRESALIATLDPGLYTAIVSGKNGATGVGLVEVYDLDEVVTSRMANISTRGSIETGEEILIGGIIVDGLTSAHIIVRALGPSLTAAGVADALADPTLEIHGANGSILFSNNDWRELQETELEESGLAPTDDREAAIVATLPASNYTAIVRGKDGTTGVGLVEVYNVD
ncbi:MAG: hypothetical protein ABI787_00715 [Spartobacteria bacterium]